MADFFETLGKSIESDITNTVNSLVKQTEAVVSTSSSGSLFSLRTGGVVSSEDEKNIKTSSSSSTSSKSSGVKSSASGSSTSKPSSSASTNTSSSSSSTSVNTTEYSTDTSSYDSSDDSADTSAATSSSSSSSSSTASKSSVPILTSGGVVSEADAKAISASTTTYSTSGSSTGEATSSTDYDILTLNVSEQIVNMKLEQTMNDEIDSIIKKAGGTIASDEVKAEVKATIRGHMSANLTQQGVIISVTTDVRSYINEYVSNQLKIITNSEIYKATQEIRNKSQEIQQILGKYDTTEKATTQLSIKLVEGLKNMIDKNNKYDEFIKKLSSSTFDLGFCKITVGIDGILNYTVAGIEKKLAKTLEKTVGPYIKDAIKIIQEVESVLKKVDEAIQKAQQALTDLITKYQNMATQLLNEYANKLAAEISSKIKIDFKIGI